MNYNSDDFDEDIDDILNSDRDDGRKINGNIRSHIDTNKNSISNDENIKDLFSKPPISSLNDSISTDRNNQENIFNSSTVKPNDRGQPKRPNLNSKLFDDEPDPLLLTDVSKTTPNTKTSSKPAKSVLNDLLNPSKDLEEFNFIKKPSEKKENGYQHDDSISVRVEYRPSTGEQKVKDSSQLGNKRSVRFSTETLLDDNMDFDSSFSSRNRPVTAPDLSNVEKPKTKFISRFEAAEYEELPIRNTDADRFDSDSDYSLWKDAKLSDENVKAEYFENDADLKGRDAKDNVGKAKDSNFKSPKDTLSDFMQSDKEDFSFLKSPRTTEANVELNSARMYRRRSSMGDILEKHTKTGFNEFDKETSTVPMEISFDRPKTGHGRTETNLSTDEFDRKTSALSNDLPFDRPKTSYSRADINMPKTELKFLHSNNDILNPEMDMKLRQIQAERDDLQFRLQALTKRHTEELDLMEKNYKNRIDLFEENSKRKEKRLQEEIDLLSEQNKQKLQMLEQERLEMRSELALRQDETENQKRQEISRIKEQHKLEVDLLKTNHEDAMKRFGEARHYEESMLQNAQPTTTELQKVLKEVSSGTKELSAIREELLAQLNQQIKEKDEQLKVKNENLRILETRLEKERQDNVAERENLQSLITKLDLKLKEQTKSFDEDRWSLRQEQNKLAALQSSLEKEREQILIEKEKNQASIEEFRKRLLDEQKAMFEKLYEEKRMLSEERAKLTVEISKWSEANQFSTMKKNQEYAELEGMRSAVVEERRDLEKQKDQLIKERDEIMHMKSQLESQSFDSRMKSEKLNLLEKELSTRKDILDGKEEHYRLIELRSEESLQKAKELHSSHQDQLSTIQRQLMALKEKEQQVSKQMMQLENCRKDMKDKEKVLTCRRCSGPLLDNMASASFDNLNTLPPTGSYKRLNDARFNRSGYSVEADLWNAVEFSNSIASQLEEERLLHSIKMDAENDREFLNHERAFLDSLSVGGNLSWHNPIQS